MNDLDHIFDVCNSVVMKNFFNTNMITLIFKPFQLHY